MVKAQQLKNGINVHLVPFAGTEAVTLLVLVKVGSRNESLPVWGGSHFIEHLMFKGTKKRPKTIDISRELDRYGAEYNAYTGKDLTGYYVKIDAQKAGVAVDLLHDMLFHSHYDAKEVTREKKVIIEEIKMYEENPIMHVEDLLEEAMFDGHVLGRNIAGTAKSMMAMRREDVLKYRDAYYIPSRMTIVMAGKVPKDAMQQLERTFGKVKKGKAVANIEPFVGRVPTDIPIVRIQNKPLEQMQVAIGFEAPGRGHEDMEALKLLGVILGGTMSSRLFIEVRERKALCYSVRASIDAYEDMGIFSIRAGLDASRLTLAMDVIMREIRKVVKDGVTADELAMAKDNIRGGMMLRLEDSSDRAEYFGRQQIFFGEVSTPEERMKKFSAVTLADIKRVAAQVLDLRKMSIAAIGPYKNEREFLKHFPQVRKEKRRA
ncbi:MAG: Processing peptidase [Candidatus Uhrbacteria bacterium GW2011_GWD2_52_7]|uniref:Processing peptidase n=1 Tax=Candidatus Uhrbacteria bacterium GW2011_GWD2_52_7 TaxID=1618989 RepID=A0A0G1XFD4_9BACT|nr:MAG: Processing peptidase [Candidatus Uhrbacteria bacterium GW2011_GWD2_52_7]